MSTIEVAGKDGGTVTLDVTLIERLRAELRGPLLLPGDDGYDAARTIYNAMIDRRPALIVVCAGVADVMAAVKLAGAWGLLLSVKGGGHNVAGNAICQDGLLIDLSAMRSVVVDPKARTARAEGGTTWGDFDAETQAFGLATTGGLISATGVAGLTLGGGIGWLMRAHGLACDNLLSLDVVTAEGALVTGSATENPELFWGLRGGGGNFGIVTSFEFQLHPVGPLFAGMLFYPLDRAAEILRVFRDVVTSAPDALGAMAGFTTTPDGVQVLALILVYNGSPQNGETILQPLRNAGSPISDTLGLMAYRDVQVLFDANAPSGLRNYWKSSFMTALSDEAIKTLVTRFATHRTICCFSARGKTRTPTKRTLPGPGRPGRPCSPIHPPVCT